MLHLYKHQLGSIQINEVLKLFSNTKSIDIADAKSVEESDVYFVEIQKIEKEFLLHIKRLLSSKKDALIYFYINDSHSLMLFQLSSFLNVKSIFTKKNDLNSIVSKINTDLIKFQSINQEHQMIENLSANYFFVLFESNKLVMASQRVYDEFGYTKLDEVDAYLETELDMKSILKKDITLKKELSFLDQKEYFSISSVCNQKNNQTIIYFEKINKNQEDDSSKMDFIKVRILFIERLKEKILEQTIVKSELGLITLGIDNMVNLRDDWEDYDIEIAVKNLLLQVKIELDTHSFIAQYNNNLYITLFEDLDFDALKAEAIKINTLLAEYTKKQKIKPRISLYALDVGTLELNNILGLIADISNNKISSKSLEEHDIHRVLGVDEELDDATIIDQLLQSVYVNKTELKLQNIYKGLCINTASKIVKKTGDTVYLSFEKLQGTAMNFEKQTLLQSSGFFKDISASVNYIDFNKRIVQLQDFKFMQGNANNRQYSRVTCSQRTPIALKHDKGVVNGVISDISLNSIAIKSRLNNNISSLKLSQIKLSFTLPIKSSEEGFVKLDFEAKVVFSVCDDEYCKIVVNLLENQANEALLMEYVYGRQKEIIIELKKQSNMIL